MPKPKFCVNGHQMEDTWEVCPYCHRTGYQTSGGSQGGAKTKIEGDLPEPRQSSARKTVVLSEIRKAPVVGWFVALNGEQRGEDFRIREGQNTIGSAADADIILHDKAVSGKHASLRYKDQKFYLTDLDSTNGTFLNDKPDPIAREELKDNDVIRIGEVSLKFKCL